MKYLLDVMYVILFLRYIRVSEPVYKVIHHVLQQYPEIYEFWAQSGGGSRVTPSMKLMRTRRRVAASGDNFLLLTAQ